MLPSLGPDSGGGNDVIDGGPGEFDRVSYEARTRGVRVDLVDAVGFDGAPGERDKLSGVENVIGGSGDDVLIGNEVRNNLEGGAGNDRLVGGAGRDFLYGGDGNDVIDGGIGGDHIDGGVGKDIVRGGAGEDYIDARGDGATIDGGPGSDNFIIGHPRSLRCGSGNYDTVSKPRGLLLSDCESVQVGASGGYPVYFDFVKVNVRPRRGRTGGLRFPWLCTATANRCDMRVTVRQGSALVGRRSAVLFKRDAEGVIVVAAHKTIRRRQPARRVDLRRGVPGELPRRPHETGHRELARPVVSQIFWPRAAGAGHRSDAGSGRVQPGRELRRAPASAR